MPCSASLFDQFYTIFAILVKEIMPRI